LVQVITVNGEPLLNSCIFCAIASGEVAASIVHQDEHTLSFIDLRQFNPGHVLVIPRRHLADVRELEEPLGSALMASVVRITRAVASAFPHEGISLWHSIGPAAFQEVPHLHIHVHPRRTRDGILRVYPSEPPHPTRDVLEQYAAAVRVHL
jgi:histidine triad (HIT) family protein